MNTALIIAAVYITFFAALALGLWINGKLENRRWRFLKK